MPAKVNPVIPECVNQCCFTIFGMDVTVNWAVAEGQLQLNAFDPVMVHELLTGHGVADARHGDVPRQLREGIEINADLGVHTPSPHRRFPPRSTTTSATSTRPTSPPKPYIPAVPCARWPANAPTCPAEQLDEILDPIRLARGLGQTCRERQE